MMRGITDCSKEKPGKQVQCLNQDDESMETDVACQTEKAELYGNMRRLNCTEIFMEQPSDLLARAQV